MRTQMTPSPDGPRVRGLHILILVDRDWTHPQAGGTGTNLRGQVSRWLEWGHRVTVIAGTYPGAARTEQEGNLSIHRMGTRSTVFPKAIWAVWRKRIGADADVVLEVVNGVTFLTPLWLRKPRLVLIHHVHSDHYVAEMGRKGRLAAFLLETAPLRVLYRHASFLTISESSREEIVRQLGIARERIEVGYIGVEAERFPPGPQAPEPTLLYVGRLKAYKRIELLLDVVEQLPEARLELVGDGDHAAALRAEIERRGLAVRVQLHGFVSEEEKARLMARAWVLLTASSAEGWCLTVMEAASAGVPSASLRVGGLPESIVHEQTGLLAEDREELAGQVARLLEDGELRRRLGAAARERAAGFTWEHTAGQTLGLLEAEGAAGDPAAQPFALASSLLRSETAKPALLAFTTLFANFLALVFTIVFARLLGASEYGSLAALVASFLILSVPGAALQVVVAREVTEARLKGETALARSVRRWMWQLGCFTVALAVVSVLLRQQIANLIGVDEVPWAAAAVLPAGGLWLVLSAQRGVLQGLRSYGTVGLSIVGEATGRFVWALLLVGLGAGVAGAFYGTPLSLLTAVLVLSPLIHRRLGGHHAEPAPARHLTDLLKRIWIPVLALALIAVLQNIDVIVVKHNFSDSLSGAYAAASVAAKVLIFISIGVGFYLLPETAQRTAQGRNARAILYRSLGLVGSIAAVLLVVYGLAPELVLRLAFGPGYGDGASALFWLAAAMTMLACTYLVVQYLLGQSRSEFVVALAVMAAVEPLVLRTVHSSLQDVAMLLFGVQLVLAVTVLALALFWRTPQRRLQEARPPGQEIKSAAQEIRV